MRRKPRGTGDSSAKGRGRGRKGYRTTGFPKYGAGKQRLEAHMDPTEEDGFWLQQRNGGHGEPCWGRRRLKLARSRGR